MKLIIYFFLSVWTISTSFGGQLFCLCDKTIGYPEFAGRLGAEGSFLVQFDIEEFKPRNFRILSASGKEDVFKSSIIEILNDLIYLKDSSNYQLRLTYIFRPSSAISTSYVEAISENEIRIVARTNLVAPSHDEITMLADPRIDTVYLYAVVPYKSGKAKASNIIVERIFHEVSDSTIIRRNNYPGLETDIYRIAKEYSKNKFLARGSHATHFFIRFNVERDLPECGLNQVF